MNDHKAALATAESYDEVMWRERAEAAEAALADERNKVERELRKAKLGLDHALMFATMPHESRKTLIEIASAINAALEGE